MKAFLLIRRKAIEKQVVSQSYVVTRLSQTTTWVGWFAQTDLFDSAVLYFYSTLLGRAGNTESSIFGTLLMCQCARDSIFTIGRENTILT